MSTGVREGIAINLVNYTSMSHDADFLSFIQRLETVDTAKLNKNQTLSLFMNAYNGVGGRLVLDCLNLPPGSACNQDGDRPCLSTQHIRSVRRADRIDHRYRT